MRSQVQSPLAETAAGATAEAVLSACVHCGMCNATCPTYALTGDARNTDPVCILSPHHAEVTALANVGQSGYRPSIDYVYRRNPERSDKAVPLVDALA